MKYKVIFFLIISLVLTNRTIHSQWIEKELTLDDIYRFYKFYPRGIENFRSMKNGLEYTVLEEFRRIEKYDYKNGEHLESIFNIEDQKHPELKFIEEYEFSPDENKILITANRENIYRHSFMADFYVYDIPSAEFTPLSDNGKQQLATFSPDGKHIAFVRDNNLFIKDLESKVEIKVTHDGEKNKIINGAPDWVYEEEFAFSKAFSWSPDSKKLAYYRFDESRVKLYTLTMFEDLYPDWYQYKYPKAGEENSVVDIHVYNLSVGENVVMDIGREEDIYIPRIKWTNNEDTLAIFRLNRLQNHFELIHADANTGQSKIIFEEKEDKYISEPTDDMITYLGNGNEFLLKSERDGWFHLYLVNFRKGHIQPITTGHYDVIDFIGLDEKSGRVYYSSHERSPKNKDVYSIMLDGTSKKLLTYKEGWNNAVFSSGFRYFINEYSSANSPPVYSLHDSRGNLLRMLEKNSDLRQRMKEYRFNEIEFTQVPISDDLSLNAFMIKPPEFDSNKKYPLFMFVYGGPESQKVTDQFSLRMPWFQYIASKGYVVVCVDNRGTGGRGEEFRKSTYLQLGKLETNDQITSAVYFSELPYIDEDRIGIFGWSYGGYLSLSCLFKGADIFKMAVAVAPVTNWRFYDTIYTERFLRKPQDNPEGYDQNSPINFVKLMKGNLLLIHGMADDNVHMQNSTELVKSLVNADKQFDMQFYPNKNHGIYGENTSYHLYTRMSNFIFEKL